LARSTSIRRSSSANHSLYSGNAELLAKCLKKIVVRVLHLHDFKPSKTKFEKGDIEGVVSEFRRFLEMALAADGKEQSTIVEIR
jgi:hypothetical protein